MSGMNASPVRFTRNAIGSDTYSMEAWYSDANLSANKKFSFSTPIHENITLYLGWKLTVNSDPVDQFEYSNKNITALELSDGVTTIGKAAFYKNQLRSLTFPKSLKRIDNFAFSHNQLMHVIFPEDAEIESIGAGAFSAASTKNHINHNHIRYLKLPSNNKLTHIGKFAFAYNALTQVSIPPGITNSNQIDDYAFINNYRIVGIDKSDKPGHRRIAYKQVISLTKVNLSSALYKSLHQKSLISTYDLSMVFGVKVAKDTITDRHITYLCYNNSGVITDVIKR